MDWKILGLNPGRHESFLSLSKCPDWHSVPPSFISPEVNRPGREGYQSPPFSAEVKKKWSYTSVPLYVLMVWTATTLPLPTSIIREFLIFQRYAYMLLLLLLLLLQIWNTFIFI